MWMVCGEFNVSSEKNDSIGIWVGVRLDFCCEICGSETWMS
jgi:hypothetical protein